MVSVLAAQLFLVVVMKPLVSDGALRALFITVGGVLCAVAVALADLPEVIHPRWVVLMASIGGILGGKDALTRRGDIPINELPLDFVERKTDPQ
jgi:hypothetical protein